MLKEGDSINFTKASCTLDGCVKIYTSRVDSVDSETKKLMSGLADSHDLDTIEGEIDPDAPVKTRKRKAHVSTIESNPESLNLKKFDSEFMVDPLFKKTSADFDEGGARGLLLNHLQIGLNGRIVFDASDAYSLHTSTITKEEPKKETVDVAQLKKLFADALKDLDKVYICPSLRDFQFNSANSDFDPQKYLETAQDYLNVPDEPEPMHMADAGGYDDDDDAPGFGGDMMMDDGGGFEAADMSIMPIQSQAHADPNAIPRMLDQMRKSRLSLVPEEAPQNGDIEWTQDQNDIAQHELFSYFDRAMIKNWSGPEMWKAKKAIPSMSILFSKTTYHVEPAVEEGATPAERKKRTKTSLSFFDTVSEDDLFAKPKSLSTLDIPKTQQAKKEDHLLPPDLLLGSKDFLGLFMKPGFTLRFKKKSNVGYSILLNDDLNSDAPEQEGDAAFWAENEVQPEGAFMGESLSCTIFLRYLIL